MARSGSRLRRGWCLGPPEFKAQLLERMEGKLGDHHAGELKRESAQAKAERIIREELRRLGWTERDLQERPKSDPAKLALAARVRRETTLTMPWLAGRLHLGSWKSFASKLHRWRKAHEKGRHMKPNSSLTPLRGGCGGGGGGGMRMAGEHQSGGLDSGCHERRLHCGRRGPAGQP